MWQPLKDYFSFTKKERNGIFFVVFIIILITVLPYFFHLFVKDEPIGSTEFAEEIEALKIDSSKSKSYSKNAGEYYDDYTPSNKKEENVKRELFYFDPNTASENDWIRLGVRKRTAQTIKKYIEKGGKFYKPQDIKKIYGLSDADANSLIPYVSISSVKKQYTPNEDKFTQTKTYPNKYLIQPVDINVGDTSAYIALPGIGSVLSKRIISFREKLGGFYSVNQVAETYNLPDSTFEKVKKYLVLNSKAMKKININSASVDEMRAHPYISYSIANAIFQYRQQHGNFTAVDDLHKIMTISDEFFTKASPYLSVE
jgi:competence protein ComEA